MSDTSLSLLSGFMQNLRLGKQIDVEKQVNILSSIAHHDTRVFQRSVAWKFAVSIEAGIALVEANPEKSFYWLHRPDLPVELLEKYLPQANHDFISVTFTDTFFKDRVNKPRQMWLTHYPVEVLVAILQTSPDLELVNDTTAALLKHSKVHVFLQETALHVWSKNPVLSASDKVDWVQQNFVGPDFDAVFGEFLLAYNNGTDSTEGVSKEKLRASLAELLSRVDLIEFIKHKLVTPLHTSQVSSLVEFLTSEELQLVKNYAEENVDNIHPSSLFGLAKSGVLSLGHCKVSSIVKDRQAVLWAGNHVMLQRFSDFLCDLNFSVGQTELLFQLMDTQPQRSLNELVAVVKQSFEK